MFITKFLNKIKTSAKKHNLKKSNVFLLRKTIINDSTKFEGDNFIGACNLENSEIGKHTYIGSGRLPFTKVGRYCSISNDVFLSPYTHAIDFISTYPGFYSKLHNKFPYGKCDAFNELIKIENSDFSLIIGNDVWIGEHVLIKPGITIGDGAIVGMGSVVTHNVDPYTIVAGNPAKVIRKRFDDKKIKKLLDIKWWNWPDEKIHNEKEYFIIGDLDER